eukprot:366392-Chlamydomonas_euryale.AAC.3
MLAHLAGGASYGNLQHSPPASPGDASPAAHSVNSFDSGAAAAAVGGGLDKTKEVRTVWWMRWTRPGVLEGTSRARPESQKLPSCCWQRQSPTTQRTWSEEVWGAVWERSGSWKEAARWRAPDEPSNQGAGLRRD